MTISNALMSEEKSVCVIQNAWRCYRNKKIYKELKSLIEFRLQGNPSLLLRGINPSEARLLDAALPSHIRFRLGGIQFPPQVYYKIYTHGNVVDLNAFAPRDYDRLAKSHAMLCRLQRIFKNDSHGHKMLQHYQNKDLNMYRRFENNGWRRAVFDRPTWDPIEQASHNSKSTFNHDKALRKHAKLTKKKRKRVLWLQKMFTAHPPRTDNVQDPNDEQVLEISDKDLLQWAESVDYEAYTRNWYSIGCSNVSELDCIQLFLRDHEQLHSSLPSLPALDSLLENPYARASTPPHEVFLRASGFASVEHISRGEDRKQQGEAKYGKVENKGVQHRNQKLFRCYEGEQRQSRATKDCTEDREEDWDGLGNDVEAAERLLEEHTSGERETLIQERTLNSRSVPKVPLLLESPKPHRHRRMQICSPTSSWRPGGPS